jgi:aldehyde:ferredoxin oxidoreductase
MKLIRIDVNNDTINSEEITHKSKYYLMGARGLTSQLIYDEVPPKCNPLSKENKLIIANGILAGSPFPNSARTSIGAKSPLTNGIKESNVGGRPAMMMAQHGIRALIFEGISSKLRLLIISDNGITIDLAGEYKGLGNYDLHDKLREKYGDKIGIYSIGPAGENLMKNSSVAANDLEGYPSRHAARGGMGAVMGSKGIKAIVIIPTKSSKVKIQEIKKFREISAPFAKMLAETRKTFSIYGTALGVNPMSEIGGLPTKNFRMGSFEGAKNISGEKLNEYIVKRNGKNRLACSPTCVIRCSNLFVDGNGKHITSSLEYETIALNGSNLMIENLDVVAHIDHLCDDIGIDTIEFGGTIGVAMDVGEIAWGDGKKVIEILEEIRKNSEKGKLYGNGVYNIGIKLKAKRIPQIKGQGVSAYDPRVMKGMGVTFATSPMGADHTAGAAIAGRSANKNKDYGDLKEDKGKLDLSYELQVYTAVLDSMGCCYFIGPSYETMEIIAGVINAMYNTTLSREDVINIGKHILKIEVDFNEEAGITQDMNDVPEFFRTESVLPTHLKYTIPKENLKNFWKKLDEN